MKAMTLDATGSVGIIIPDSAITLQGRPIVLPGNDARWSLRIALAWRIGRLGKSISSRFASRYVDAVTIAAMLAPNDEQSSEIAAKTAGAMDCALTLGEWLELQAEKSPTMTLTTDATDIEIPEFALSAAIERASEWMTLKTGDILISPTLATVTPGRRRLDASLNGKPCFSKRII